MTQVEAHSAQTEIMRSLDTSGCISAAFSKMEMTGGTPLITLRFKIFLSKCRVGELMDAILAYSEEWHTGRVQVSFEAGVERGKRAGHATISVSTQAYAHLDHIADLVAASAVAKAITR